MAGDGILTQAIDPASDRAVYRQIADHLRDAIARSRLAEGEQLPSEAQLMEHYGVARMTIRNALRILLDEGLVTAEHGRGVYVRSRPPVRRLASDRFAQRHRKEGKAAFTVEAAQIGATPSRHADGERGAATGDIADRLGLAEDTGTVVRSRRYLLDGKPVETAVSTSRPTWPRDRSPIQPGPAASTATGRTRTPGVSFSASTLLTGSRSGRGFGRRPLSCTGTCCAVTLARCSMPGLSLRSASPMCGAGGRICLTTG